MANSLSELGFELGLDGVAWVVDRCEKNLRLTHSTDRTVAVRIQHLHARMAFRRELHVPRAHGRILIKK